MLDRMLTFAGKAQKRGWTYVHAVSSYQARRLRYRIEASRENSAAAHSLPALDFHFSSDDLPRIITSIPDELKQSTTREADAVAEHRFEFRGLPEVCFPGAVDWNARPEGNLSWSWDLNRQRYFLALGTAYFYTGDAKYHATLIDLWSSWIAANPAAEGLNWQSPFEVAARLRNWTWAYALLSASGPTFPAELPVFYRAMEQHARFLFAHLEHHWPNNHLLLEAKTLHEFWLAFPESRATRKWKAEVAGILEDQVLAQVLPDGVHGELCSMYHQIIAGELGELMLLGWKLGQPLPARVEERIGKMTGFSAALLRADGSSALLGDSSPEDTCHRFDFANRGHSDLNYWLWSASSVILPPDEVPVSRRLTSFPDGGYAMARLGSGDHETHLTLDCGRFSACASANHAHCDALSFELHGAGQPLIVDPGFYFPWDGDPAWTRYFRSTAAHNTLAIDGNEQSILSDDWDSSRTARTRLVETLDTGNSIFFSGESIPFSERGQAVHRREMTLRQGQLLLRDSLRGSGQHSVQWFFHLAPRVHVRTLSANSFSADFAGRHFGCEYLASRPGTAIEVIKGAHCPLQGWVAETSSRVVPAEVVIVSGRVELPIEIEFRFCFGATSKPDQAAEQEAVANAQR